MSFLQVDDLFIIGLIINLGNLLKAIIHYLLVKDIIVLGHRGGFLMISALIYMIICTLDIAYGESRLKA